MRWPDAGDERGFTLIELLAVIMIIGILAAIAIPTFLDQRAKAYDSDAQSAVATAHTAMEIYGTEHGGYCGSDPSSLASIEPSLAQADDLQVLPCAGGDSGRYTLTVQSTSVSGGTFTLTADDGDVSRTCSAPGEGACAADGSW